MLVTRKRIGDRLEDKLDEYIDYLPFSDLVVGLLKELVLQFVF